MDHNKGKAIDLTLRLGSSNVEDGENQDPVNNELQGPLGMAVGNAEAGVNPPQQYGAEEVGSPANIFRLYPLQNLGGPSRRRRANNRVCKKCGSNNTPLWRKGPEGRQTLCNACGIKHFRAMKRAAR